MSTPRIDMDLADPVSLEFHPARAAVDTPPDHVPVPRLDTPFIKLENRVGIEKAECRRQGSMIENKPPRLARGSDS